MRPLETHAAPEPRATRRQMLAGAAGVALGGGLLITSPTRAATSAAAAPETDSDRLRRLLGVEMLLLYCYEQVLSESLLKRRARRLITAVPAQEEAHIRALRAPLLDRGGAPPVPPASITQANRDLARRRIGGRLGQLQGNKDALYLLLSLEQVVVGAYFEALAKLTDPRLITLAAQIMANDAQHEALLGEALYPGHTDKAVPSGLVQGTK